jgi:tRNA threonylcarbamoyl adenosine modification protein (Sua5/YciO/YrdC/YwlC family)
MELNTSNPQKRQIGQIIEMMKDGGVIVYPTDTTYAFGCDMNNKRGVEKILAIKKTPKDKLLSLICNDLKSVSQYGFLSNQGYKIMKHCLPGPYTFILKATQIVPRVMMTKRKTIGVRIPDNAIALAIVEALGSPMVTASVRIAKEEEIMSEPYEIESRLGHLLDCVIDAGIILPYPSTIIDMSEDPPEVLREGKGDTLFLSEP